MDFALSGERQTIGKTIRGFVESELCPRERPVEETGLIAPKPGRAVVRKSRHPRSYTDSVTATVGGGGGGGGKGYQTAPLDERQPDRTSMALSTLFARGGGTARGCHAALNDLATSFLNHIIDRSGVLPTATPDEKRPTFRGLRPSKPIVGYRRAQPDDMKSLEQLVASVIKSVADNATRLEELDLNPVLVLPEGDGVIAVDASSGKGVECVTDPIRTCRADAVLEVTIDRPGAYAPDHATTRMMTEIFAGYRDDETSGAAIPTGIGWALFSPDLNLNPSPDCDVTEGDWRVAGPGGRQGLRDLNEPVTAGTGEIIRDPEGRPCPSVVSQVANRPYQLVEGPDGREDQKEGTRAYSEKRGAVWKER